MKYFKHDLKARQNRKLWKFIKTHGMNGYGIWWSLLEALYDTEEQGFRISADELWLEHFADELRVSDSRVLTRILDTLAELELIDKQLWQERVIYAPGVIERGDDYIQQKARNRDRVKKHRDKQKQELEAESTASTPCNEFQPSSNAPVTQICNALQAQCNANTDPDPDPDPDLFLERASAPGKKAGEGESESEPEEVSVQSTATLSNQAPPVVEVKTPHEDKSSAAPPQLRKTEEPFGQQRRTFNQLKGTYRSCADDPWMISAANVDPEFRDWVVKNHTRLGMKASSPANVASEIRNSYERAGDLWSEYQEFLAAKQQRPLEVLDEPPEEEEIDFDAIRKRALARLKTDKRTQEAEAVQEDDYADF